MVMLSAGFVSLLGVAGTLIGLVEAGKIGPGKGHGPPKPPGPPIKYPKLEDGVLITECRVKNTIAITFDDGPWIYTPTLIDQFNKVGAKATFFLNGNLYGCIYDKADVVKKAYATGHQIGQHSWSHPHMLTLNSTEQDAELEKTQVALQRILGLRTRWFRPPFGETNSTFQEKLKKHKLKAVNWTFASNDWMGINATEIAANYNAEWENNPRNDYIVLNHDPLQPTGEVAGIWAVHWARQKGLKVVTLSECLGEDKKEMYIFTGKPEKKNAKWTCT